MPHKDRETLLQLLGDIREINKWSDDEIRHKFGSDKKDLLLYKCAFAYTYLFSSRTILTSLQPDYNSIHQLLNRLCYFAAMENYEVESKYHRPKMSVVNHYIVKAIDILKNITPERRHYEVRRPGV